MDLFELFRVSLFVSRDTASEPGGVGYPCVRHTSIHRYTRVVLGYICWVSNFQHLCVVPVWKVSFIEDLFFALNIRRAANRSPTPTSKTNDFLGPFDDIWRSRATVSGRFGDFLGVRAGIDSKICLIASRR